MYPYHNLAKSVLVGLAASALVFGYEVLDQLTHPQISTWQSQSIAAILGGGAAFLLTLALLRGQPANPNAARQQQKSFADAVIRDLPAIACLIDTDGTLRLWNTNFEKTLGYSTPEVAQIQVSDTIAPEDQERAQQSIQTVLETGASEIEASLLTKSGRKFPCYLSGTRIFVEKRPCVLGIAVDISERKDIEDKLRQSEAQYRSLVANIPETVWTMDRKRRINFVSPSVEKLTGYTAVELNELGDSIWPDSVHPEDKQRVAEAFDLLFATGEPYDIEYRLRRKNGEWRWVHGRSVSTYENDGVRYADGLLSDITERRLAQQGLQRLAAIVDSSKDAITGTTLEGVFTSWNEGAELVYGYPPEEAIGRNIAFLAPPEKEEELTGMRESVADGRTVTVETQQVRKDGSVIEVSLRVSPIRDPAGKITGISGIARDITSRKKADEQLHLQLAALEAAANAIVITDRMGTILWVNEAFCEMTRFAKSEVLGKNPSILNSGQHDQAFYADLWSTISVGEVWQGEVTNRRKDGTLYVEEMTITPVCSEGQEISHFIAIKQDVTERKRTEKEFRLTKTSLDNTSDSVFWIDPQGRIVYANEAACHSLGRSREELLGTSIPDIDPLFPKEAWNAYWERCKTEHSLTFETQHRTKQGRIFPVEVTANYLEFDGREYAFVLARDITERRVLETQLRQAQKLESIGQLAAGIAHEINTPIQFVNDNLTFLRDSWKGVFELLGKYRSAVGNAAAILPADVVAELKQLYQTRDIEFVASEASRAIDQSLDGAQRIAKIVRAMKEFSHPDSTDKTATNLNQAIETTITVARNEWKYVAEVVTEFDENLPSVECYPGEINQVFLNLMVNAAHAIKEKIKEGEKGQIRVRTKLRGENAEISVTDNGAGIPEAIRLRIFDPFFTTKEVGKGTGQGLALAHSVVVKKHGGKIWFETRTGQGTTFFIELPIASRAAANAAGSG
jgi:PAS domain S-box-containing protein